VNDPSSPPPDVGEAPLIRGAIVLNNLVGFAEVVGQPVVDRAVASLSTASRAEFGAIVPASWVRAALVDEVFGAISDAAGRAPIELFPEAIERGVHRTLSTVWRALMHITSDAALIRRTPSVFARTYTRGRLSARFLGTARAEVELVEWPDVTQTRLIAISSGIRAVLRIAGRKQVHVEIERTADGAKFHAQWIR
jgi:hypothetical protein